MQEPLESSELLAFAKTVEAKSLSRAALELGVPRATIGRRLARLEERLGARLLRRTTRSLVLTEAGESLYRHAGLVLEAVSQAEASVRNKGETMRGQLRVSVPPFSSSSFYNLVCDFVALHPEVRVSVHSSTQLVDLKRDGYDVAIRGTSQLEPGLVARSLYRAPLLAVASPSYLAAHGTPRALRDLRQHRCLMGFERGELPQTYWASRSGAKLHLEGVMFSNNIALLCDAARRGLGIAYLPQMLVEEPLASGELVQVLKGSLEAETHLAVVYAERAFLPPQVRAFVDAVVAWAPGELGPGGALRPPALAGRALPKPKGEPSSRAKQKPPRAKPKPKRALPRASGKSKRALPRASES